MARKRSRRKAVPEGIFQASIDSLTSDARGVARIQDKVTFVDGALPGEEVTFAYKRCKSAYDEGLVESVITASPDRVDSKCPYHMICGGCSLLHLSSEAQIAMKEKALLDNLEKEAGIHPEVVLPPVTGDTWGYRNKARLGVRDVPAKGRVLVGFRERSNRYLADMLSCEVLNPQVGKQLETLSRLIGQLDARKDIAQIEVAITDDVTALVFRNLTELGEPDRKRLIDFARGEKFAVYLQPGNTDTISPLWPESIDLSYRLKQHGVDIHFQPSDFTQVNASINEQMIDRALEFLDLNENDNVLDLFCGLGNFTLPLARYAGRVLGIEGDAGLVARSRENAAANQITNVSFIEANLFEAPGEQTWVNDMTVDKLLMDPPRSGAQEVCMDIQKIKPKRIVYVSCHPATLARDAGILSRSGYQLTHAGVMDMFPHTMHVESMAVFELQ